MYHRKPQKPQIGHGPGLNGLSGLNGLPYYPNQKIPQIEASKENIGIPPPGVTRDDDREMTNPNFDSNYNLFVGFILIMWTSVALGAMAMGKHRRRNIFYYFHQEKFAPKNSVAPSSGRSSLDSAMTFRETPIRLGQ